MPKVGIGGSPHNVFAVTNKVYVYAKKAAELGVKDGSYLRIRKAAVEVILQVGVLDLDVEMPKAVKGKYEEKLSDHARDAANLVSLSAAAKKMLDAQNGEELDIEAYQPKDLIAAQLSIEVAPVKRIENPRTKKELEFDDLSESIHDLFDSQIFCDGQYWYMDYNGSVYLLTVKHFELLTEVLKKGSSEVTSHVQLTADTKLELTCTHELSIKGARNPISFDFNNLGIGGLDTEFKEIFRRTFATRLFPPKVIQSLGINHVRGMLLYGPPGCGKTLMARKIGGMLNGPEPKIVNGPEILNKFVGASEENIRNLFADAEADYKANGDKAELHVIIFDEIDAICKQRSGSSAPGSHDSIVNQLLTKIDGVDSLNNILLIGMTNRKELLDDALLRPGRLEVHVEIPLPSFDGRMQILNIHMGKALKEGLIAPDVQLETLAEMTKNYTGAEIEGVCKNAAQYALVERNMETSDGSTPKVKDLKNIRVEMNDYARAIAQSVPAFGANTDALDAFIGGEKIDFGPRYQKLVATGKAFVDQVKASEMTPLLSVLFSGPPGSGKTALACTLAAGSDFPFIKVISPEDMVGQHESAKMQRITKCFDEASRSPLSIVILDELERLLEFVPLGPRFSNVLLQTLQVLIKRKPRPGHRLIVMGTTSQSNMLHDLDLLQGFNVEVEVPYLDKEEVLETLKQYGVEAGVVSKLAPLITARIGIKKLLLILEMAKLGEARVTYESFLAAGTDCGYDFGQ